MSEPLNKEMVATFKAIVWKLSVLSEYLALSSDAMEKHWNALRAQQSMSNDETKDVLNDINDNLTKLVRAYENEHRKPDPAAGTYLT